jgi:YidC/Oxa1 family membrane protein insertase
MLHFAAIPVIGPVIDALSRVIAEFLKFLNSFTGSFGWNVVLLTIAIRIVVLPLSFKQTKSMIAMQRLQPQLKDIQKKYKEDREKMGQEMMALYKENKVSPLGGCLPLILQLPILFALFEVLRNTAKYVRYETSFEFLGISNLIATGAQLWKGGSVQMYNMAKHPPRVDKVPVDGGEYVAVIVLILLTILTGYVSSKMMTNDPKQAKMMAFMPLIFGVFAWILAAGVTLYIIVTNVTMIIQQYVQLEAEGFYDEKTAIRLKTGEPLKWHERWRFKFYDYGSIALTAVRIKRPRKTEPDKTAKAVAEKKPADKPQAKKAIAATKKAKAPAGKPAAAPAKKPASRQGTATTAQKKPVQKSEKTQPAKGPDPEKDSGKPSGGKPAAGTENKAKQYPAKKKGSRKK